MSSLRSEEKSDGHDIQSCDNSASGLGDRGEMGVCERGGPGRGDVEYVPRAASVR